MRAMRSGRARISVRNPQAMGCCDRTGFWYPLNSMRRQMQWSGNNLIDTGLLVGPDQLDKPQDQYRTPILPPDPYPRMNPRTDPTVTPVPGAVGQPLPTTPSNQGFTIFQLGLAIIGGQGGPSPPPPPAPPTPPATGPSLDFSDPDNSQYLGAAF